MPKTAKLIFIAAIVLLILGVVMFVSFIRQGALPFLPQPSPSPIPNIAKEAPVTIEQIRGTVATSSASLLALRVNGKVTNYNISKTEDIQGVVSGSPEKGDVVTVNTTKSELRAGQEVILLIEKGTNVVRSLYIFKKL